MLYLHRRYVFERRMLLVTVGQNRLVERNRPLHANSRIGQINKAILVIVTGAPVSIDAVQVIGVRLKCLKRVGDALRQKNGLVGRNLDGDDLAEGRPFAQVNKSTEYLAGD